MLSTIRGAAVAAPDPQTIQRRRVLARVACSPALAGALACLAYGDGTRDHGALLVGLVADRTAVTGARP